MCELIWLVSYAPSKVKFHLYRVFQDKYPKVLHNKNAGTWNQKIGTKQVLKDEFLAAF